MESLSSEPVLKRLWFVWQRLEHVQTDDFQSGKVYCCQHFIVLVFCHNKIGIRCESTVYKFIVVGIIGNQRPMEKNVDLMDMV